MQWDTARGHADRRLTLVTNPVGAFLAPGQQSLEREWKEALARNHGITFDRLIALNNMPMSRYLEWLADKGLVEEYMHRIVQAFNPAAIAGLMCRNTLSVSWDGYLYDCDFNQQLDMRLDLPGGLRPHVRDFDLEAWRRHVGADGAALLRMHGRGGEFVRRADGVGWVVGLVFT